MENTMAVPGAGYKDRSTGLVIFGILQIIVGGICALFVPLMLFGQLMASRAGGGEASFRMIIPSILMYVVLAAAFIAIGVGSMKARRWARALALVLAWSWLIVGVITVAVSSIVVSRAFASAAVAQGAPAGAMWIPMMIVFVFFSVAFVILPSLLVFFYQKTDVKLTCENRDPVPRWTDRLPLPVLALALWIAFAALSMLFMPLAYNGVLPFFGRLISGWPGTLLSVAVAAMWAYAAWAIYHLKPIGWWIVLVVLLVFGISAFVTFQKVEMSELYTAMGYPAAQIQQMEQLNLGGKSMPLWFLVGLLPFLGFLLFTKRYFRA